MGIALKRRAMKSASFMLRCPKKTLKKCDRWKHSEQVEFSIAHVRYIGKDSDGSRHEDQVSPYQISSPFDRFLNVALSQGAHFVSIYIKVPEYATMERRWMRLHLRLGVEKWLRENDEIEIAEREVAVLHRARSVRYEGHLLSLVTDTPFDRYLKVATNTAYATMEANDLMKVFDFGPDSS